MSGCITLLGEEMGYSAYTTLSTKDIQNNVVPIHKELT